MFPTPPVVVTLLLVSCLAAAVWDFRFRRIPNWLVLSALILGFGVNILVFGFGYPGLLGSLAGMGLALLVYMPLYIIRAMGAGDVKLMAAIGAIIGPLNWLLLFLCTALLGGLIALVFIFFRGRARQTLGNVFFMTNEIFHLRAPYLTNKQLDVKSGKGASLPHGVTIFFGAIIFLSLARRVSLFLQ